jgi:hypothetical protein
VKLSPDDFEDTVSIARDYLRGLGNPALLCHDFAEAIVWLGTACVVGLPCEKHGGVHGQEAEELRVGIEQILKNTVDVCGGEALHVLHATRKSLIFLLDQIDARDSLAFLEASAQEEESATCGG